MLRTHRVKRLSSERRSLLLAPLLFAAAGLARAGIPATFTPTFTSTVPPTSTPTPSPSFTATPVPSITPTPTPTSTRTADLSISKTGSPNPVASGQTLTYDFQVVNNGPSDVLDSIIHDSLPPQVSYVSCTVHPSFGSGTCSGGAGQVTANLGAMASGATASLTVVVQVTGTTGSITNTATVSHSGPDPDGSNNSSAAVTTIGSGPQAGPSVPATSPVARVVLWLGLLAVGWWVLRRT